MLRAHGDLTGESPCYKKGQKPMNEKYLPDDTYTLGSSQEETRRLQAQAQLLDPSTRRLFEQAGIKAGLKVLDLGSGAGDVALLLADMVGPGGTVVGVERDTSILQTARARVAAAGWSHVTFQAEDIENIQLDGEFDAIVGRHILMHLRSPTVVLHQLVRQLRPGGIVAFQEADWVHGTLLPAHPPCPLWKQTMDWIGEGFRRAGVPVRIGLDMYTAFLDAGLPAPQLGCETAIGAGADWPGYTIAAEAVRSLLPLILKFGIATAEEVAVETLEERLRAEAVSQRAVVLGTGLVTAWTRTARQ
jgi:SAM-dependent methyltransferase